jgi:hypothetical protein
VLYTYTEFLVDFLIVIVDEYQKKIFNCFFKIPRAQKDKIQAYIRDVEMVFSQKQKITSR